MRQTHKAAESIKTKEHLNDNSLWLQSEPQCLLMSKPNNPPKNRGMCERQAGGFPFLIRLSKPRFIPVMAKNGKE